jgi:predicted lipid-binding transport protein (Tim44 family)
LVFCGASMITVLLACLAFSMIAILFRAFGRVRKEPEIHIVIEEGESGNTKELSTNINSVKNIFPDFDVSLFLNEAERLLFLVFEAFTKSDCDTLTSMLTTQLYKKFLAQIQKRDQLSLKQEILIKHNSSSIDSVQILEDKVNMLVAFDVSQMSAIYRMDGSPIDNPNKIYRKIMHRWTFERMYSDSNWLISNTSSVEV